MSTHNGGCCHPAHFVPPNLKFELDDAELPWTYQPDIFDFVYLRYLMGAISDWLKLYSEAFKYVWMLVDTKPVVH
jgi:hypothetical protein